MKQYINPAKSKTFNEKTAKIQKLINSVLYILDCFGIPIDTSPRRLERMAIAFLACGDIKEIEDLKIAKDWNSGYSINPTYAELIRDFGSKDWEKTISDRLKNIEPLSLKLKRERTIPLLIIMIPRHSSLGFGFRFIIAKGLPSFVQHSIRFHGLIQDTHVWYG